MNSSLPTTPTLISSLITNAYGNLYDPALLTG
jgi:hypothetical protein